MNNTPPAMRRRTATVFSQAAMTLVELLVTITVLSVLAALAMPVYSNVRLASERALATDHIEALNRAVMSFSQNCWKLPIAADAAASDDEFAVVRSLQYEFPANMLKPGSPYFDSRYSPSTSSNLQHFRIGWNGTSFELIDLDTSGTGLRFNSGADYGEPYSFPADYKPEGAL